MPAYFAYGANLDVCGMAHRCPRSAMLGQAQLRDHRFVIVEDGYASVVPHMGSVVHGALWDLASEDVPALDRFEEVEDDLYRKVVLPVAYDARNVEALVYLANGQHPGRPRPGYLESVLDAAARCDLPESYCAELSRWLPL